MAVDLWSKLGQAISAMGYQLSLPEWGVSERFGVRTPPQVVSPLTQQQSMGTAPISWGTPISNIGPATKTQVFPSYAVGAIQRPSDQRVVEQPGGGGGGGQPSGPTMEEQIAGVYNPAFESLSLYEQRLREGLPVQEELVRKSSEPLLADIESQRAIQAGEIASQQALGEQTKGTAYAEARRLYNELQRGILARFGTGASTGPAASEILAREVQTQFGDIGQQAANLQESLGRQILKLNDFVANERQRILTNQETKITQLGEDFKNELTKIAGQKGVLRSAQAAAKLDLLEQYRTQAAQLSYDVFRSSLSLSQWRAQQEMALTESFKTIPTGWDRESWNAYGQALGRLSESMPAYMTRQTPRPMITAPKISFKLPTYGKTPEEEEQEPYE